jgi:hypothetical protein
MGDFRHHSSNLSANVVIEACQTTLLVDTPDVKAIQSFIGAVPIPPQAAKKHINGYDKVKANCRI